MVLNATLYKPKVGDPTSVTFIRTPNIADSYLEILIVG